MLFQPQPAFRFRVIPSIQPELSSIFSLEVDNAMIDLKNKTLAVEVRHSSRPDLFEAISEALGTSTIKVDLMDGSYDNAHQSYSTVNTKLVSHEFEFSYSDNKSLIHRIVWSFSHLNEWSKPLPESPSMVEVKGFVSPEEAIAAVEKATKAKKQADKKTPSV